MSYRTLAHALERQGVNLFGFDLCCRLLAACASILWRDAAKAPEAASALKITGKDLLKLGIIDDVLPEPSGGNNWAPLDAGNTLKEAIEKHLNALLQMPEDQLIDERYKKFRVLGKFIEANNIEEIYSEIPQKTE